jgi:hypothetical protein
MLLGWTKKIILNAKPGGRKDRGRPELKWGDGVDNDVKPPWERNWKKIARNRSVW